MRRSILYLLLFLLGTLNAPAVLPRMRLDGDKLTLNAHHSRLMDVLHRFAEIGVVVRVDPEVNADITANVTDVDVEKALEKLLDPFGYILIWDVIDGPLGPFPKLAEIQVFRPGQKDKIRPLPGVEENFRIAVSPDGSGAKFVQDEILIGFKAGTRREEVEILIRELGGTLIGSIPEAGIYQIRLSPGSNVLELVRQLEKNRIIAAVEPNYITEAGTPILGSTSEAAVSETGKPEIAPGAPPVAILDSGILADSGLGDLIVNTYDAVHPDREVSDRLGHGTQMAMIASGAVSPAGMEMTDKGVPVVAIRAFDDNGNASNFSLMRSISYALDHGARVINMSWGSDTPSEFLHNVIDYAQSKGAVVVASAGNEPTGKKVYPAAYPGVLGVSAVESDGQLWAHSNSGKFVSFSAPGTAELPVGYKGPAGSYAGTSISSAYLSGALARYFSIHPEATADQAIDALKKSATDMGAKGKDPSYGYGLIDTAALTRLLK